MENSVPARPVYVQRGKTHIGTCDEDRRTQHRILNARLLTDAAAYCLAVWSMAQTPEADETLACRVPWNRHPFRRRFLIRVSGFKSLERYQ